MQSRTQQNKAYLDTGILDKLEFIENAENSVVVRRLRQVLAILWFDKYKKYFKVFGGWEVLDESRNFPHNWRNLPLLHHYSIRKWQFILLWWIGTDNKKSTQRLYSYLLPKAQKIICREAVSVKRAKKYSADNTILFQDFSKEILNVGVDLKSSLRRPQNIILINVGPKYFTKTNLNKIKKYISVESENSHSRLNQVRKGEEDISRQNKNRKGEDRNHRFLFFPADINFDKQYYPQLRKEIPNLEIYDRTKHSLVETIELFKSCAGGVWSRLHFLYPLKIFKKDLLSISDSDKVGKMI